MWQHGREVFLNGSSSLGIVVAQPENVTVDVDVEGQIVQVINDNDVGVTVTATGENGPVSFDVPADDSASQRLDPGNYTLTGETDDGRLALLNGLTERNVTIGASQTRRVVSVAVDGQRVGFGNPNEDNVTVTAAPESGANLTVAVPAEATTSETFDPGNYTLTAETDDGDIVLLNDFGALDITVAEEPLPPANLTVQVDRQNVSIENPSNTSVTVETFIGTEQGETIDIGPGETFSDRFIPTSYTLTGTAEDGRPVLLNGVERLDITVEPYDPVGVEVDGQNITFTNPNDVPVLVFVITEDGPESEVTVPAEESLTRTFEPGSYTLSAAVEPDNAVVPIGGEDQRVYELVITAGSTPTPTATAEPTTTENETPDVTETPAQTPEVMETPEPTLEETETPEPTSEPTPEETETPEPTPGETETPEPAPEQTPEPTAEPTETTTPDPVETPLPSTETPVETDTPLQNGGGGTPVNSLLEAVAELLPT